MFGIAINGSGGTANIDDGYSHLHPKEYGQAPLSWGTLGTYGSVTFQNAIDFPVVFVRCPVAGKRFTVRNVSTTGFAYRSEDVLDWVVYRGSPDIDTATSEFGMKIFAADGMVLFSSNNPPPKIIGASVLMASEPTTTPAAIDAFPQTLSYSGQSLDGGFPYIAASTLTPLWNQYITQPTSGLLYCVHANFQSAVSVLFSLLQTQYTVPLSASVGAFPRVALLVGVN